MKKNYFLGMATLGLLTLAACSSDEDPIIDNPTASGTQEIVLQVVNSGDGLTTRAGRPLNSSAAGQTIENVKVIIVNDENKIVKVKEYSNWVSGDASTYANGYQTTLTLKGNEKLNADTYTVYAFGYSNNSDYDVKPITNLAVNGTFNPNITLEFKSDATNKIGEEIFAGSLDGLVVSENGEEFRKEVVLNRQVAGTFGYLKDIPYMDGKAAKLRLVASTRNTQLVLGNFANFDLTSNGDATTNTGHINYVVNGTSEAEEEAHVIYEITLTDWFGTVKDADNDGLIDVEDNWTGAKADAEKYAEGSVFAGEFLIPFAKVTSPDAQQTFRLQLVDNSGNELRGWNVNLPSTDGQVEEHTLTAWAGSDFTEESVTDTKNCYSVVRNHLYGIGTRTLDDPDVPGTENEDEPETLNTVQELVLKVNSNWEVIHKMEIE